jgi:hypothetical protein
MIFLFMNALPHRMWTRPGGSSTPVRRPLEIIVLMCPPFAVSQTKVPRSEAMKFPNKTWPLLGEEDSYMFALDVFHELHCLVRFSRAVSSGSLNFFDI